MSGSSVTPPFTLPPGPTEQDFSIPQRILNNAKELSHHEGLWPLDARVGAVMQFGNCIIISPNADYVPQFPFIDDGKVVPFANETISIT
ncbi:uncharacterized protein FOMMEDRAFT_159692 [Fomitiporia mediterranea MF3/22]|uniref:uncharacterized protein n=1 Tax=Fomitiporia mediterranea (strain MF3/22) TaxID=694068 RepID=UPI00044090B8|nr:uncharacterized protein FOMMEDRAFT_159692 [Fomitiporia mediterranea MF3/22]EJD00080.1 hypothetical protein FOMMEDRAFT_159692 [Fomitiporia mediterranea MF3/22]